MKNFFKWLAIIFIALLVIGLIFGNDSTEQRNYQNTITTASTNQEPTSVAGKLNPNFTGSQSNAVRSAEQYLSISGFSRDGLIRQLSSDAGDGYEVSDATVAVDSLNVNWNEQAARSAKQYLEISGFSCNGLIEQLSSDAGDKYTVSQATYGAQQAGACS